MLGRSIWWINL